METAVEKGVRAEKLPTAVPRATPRELVIPLACFLASGASGLIYQVVWMRELTLVFGATTLAVSTVLATFMGGLAIGSFVGGRFADRDRNPLRTYAIIEIVIGLYGLAVPFLFELLPFIYQPMWRAANLSFATLSLVRFLLAAVVLAIPTTLMGATLPILSRFVVTAPSAVGRDIGALYTVNTLGAVAGAAASGLILIPTFGMTATTVVAAGLNLFAGIGAFAAARKLSSGSTVELLSSEGAHAAAAPDRRRATPHTARYRVFALYAAFALSGVAALVYEVAWTRALSLILGSSVYAFTIMLTTFLVGLALGSGLGSWMVDRLRRPVLVLAAVEAGVGLSAFAGLYLFRELPYIFLFLFREFEGSPTALLLLTRLLIAALVMLVPTMLLGMVFPLMVRSAVRLEAIGTSVGTLYAANTIGAIAGAFLTGFVLITWLGVQGSIVAAIGLNLIATAVLVPASDAIAPRWRVAGVLAAVLLILVPIALRPEWDPAIMSSGVFRYAPSIETITRKEFYEHYASKGDGETVYYKDGVAATVSVQQQHDHFILKVNGKPDATTAGDLPTQALVAHLPLLAHPDPSTALVIGWGSGVSVGAALTHPLDQVTAVELEPAVVEASRFFEGVNGRPLDDPRTELLINDGRNVLAATDRRFDVIISEPSNPWLTGVANLFTREYFEAGAEHLDENGVFCQWLQIYELQTKDVATLMATFSESFPEVFVFRATSGDLVLLGSRSPLRLDANRIARRMAPETAAGRNLAQVGIASPTALLSRLYLTPPAAAAFGAGAPINTDDNALIEFSAPLRVGIKEEATDTTNIAAIEAVSGPLAPYVEGIDAEMLAEMSLIAVARGETMRAERFALESLSLGETARAHSVLGELRSAAGRDEEAQQEWLRALQIAPDDLATNLNLGKYYLGKGNFEAARLHLERAVAVAPEDVRARHMRGLLYQIQGEYQSAFEDLDLVARDAKYVDELPVFSLHYGRALLDVGRYQEALVRLERYIEREPKDPLGFYEYGQALLVLGDQENEPRRYILAENAFLQALTLDRMFAEAHRGLSLAYRKQGQLEDAEEEFEIYLQLKRPDAR